MMSDPSDELMHKEVAIKPFKTTGAVRGYDPASKKWWVVKTFKAYKSAWYSKIELEVKA